jgi:hypothetical protein
MLEYAIALLILACLSGWALTKPRRRSVRLG